MHIINAQILHQHYLLQRQKLTFFISTTYFTSKFSDLSHFASTILHFFIFIQNKRLLFVFTPPVSYDKYSDFSSALHILGAKAQIFHQRHLFQKQTLIFSILTAKKLLKIHISKFKYYLSLSIQMP